MRASSCACACARRPVCQSLTTVAVVFLPRQRLREQEEPRLHAMVDRFHHFELIWLDIGMSPLTMPRAFSAAALPRGARARREASSLRPSPLPVSLARHHAFPHAVTRPICSRAACGAGGEGSPRGGRAGGAERGREARIRGSRQDDLALACRARPQRRALLPQQGLQGVSTSPFSSPRWDCVTTQLSRTRALDRSYKYQTACISRVSRAILCPPRTVRLESVGEVSARLPLSLASPFRASGASRSQVRVARVAIAGTCRSCRRLRTRARACPTSSCCSFSSRRR
eukprot:2545295-Pleurochrysis_carterae.AAC.1